MTAGKLFLLISPISLICSCSKPTSTLCSPDNTSQYHFVRDTLEYVLELNDDYIQISKQDNARPPLIQMETYEPLFTIYRFERQDINGLEGEGVLLGDSDNNGKLIFNGQLEFYADIVHSYEGIGFLGYQNVPDENTPHYNIDFAHYLN